MARRTQEFQTLRSEGGLLPPDLLRRVINPRGSLKGTRPEDYGLPQGERLNEVITQSWNRLRRHWSEFRAVAAKLPEGEAATGLTNDKWSLPLLRELGFGLLPTSAGPEIAGRTYAISRFFGSVPVHLVGCGLSLDRRAAGVRGAAGGNPHGLVQEVLNRSPDHLWGIVGNGLRMRILRDSRALSRQAFLQFDLEAMFSAEAYSDFVLLWLVAHATRFAPRDGSRIESCWLEEWTKEAQEQGTRALNNLRGSVERALQVLGEGFTSHPKNTDLRESLRSGSLPLADFHGQLLRVVYRLIFLFVAEDRTLEGQPLLHPRDDSPASGLARERYAAHYGTARQRELAGKIKGSRHGDLWRQFQIVVAALSGEPAFEAARRSLALPALGSFLWSPASTSALNGSELSNHDLLEALRHLAYTRQGKVLRPVDYMNLGAEELGGVYESLLALTPQISADGARFTFAEFAGNERKTSGSYYTPDSLVQCLLDSALDPVVEEAIKGKSGAAAEQAILGLKVCDPAVGSGHFLVGAAHRLARHLSRVRALAQGESEPSPLLYQHALRDVIGRCLYGVDLNPMATELCRVSLWLEALEPGKPLSFLDHHIRVGNSLLGTTPELIGAGLPDEAFDAIEGDDKKVCSALKKRNRQERQGQQDMLHLMVAEPRIEYDAIAARSLGLDQASDHSVDAIARKAAEYQRLVVSPEYLHRQRVADAWCAAFVWRKAATALEPITSDAIRRLEKDVEALSPPQCKEVDRLAGQYRFFHWHLAFPEVFARGGFDCVLGNPPWERVKLQEKEWFAAHACSEIAAAPSAALRGKLIRQLQADKPDIYADFLEDVRVSEGQGHFLRKSGQYPLCGRGDVNLYALFAESMRQHVGQMGQVGCVVPSGIATDDTTKYFIQDLMEARALSSFLEFENEGFFSEAGQGHMVRFALVTLGGMRRQSPAMKLLMQGKDLAELKDPLRCFDLAPSDIALVNANTRTFPIFRTRRDGELGKAIYRRIPILVREDPAQNAWNAFYMRLVHYGDHAEELVPLKGALESGFTRSDWALMDDKGNRLLPVFESKLINQFDVFAARFNENGDVMQVPTADKENPSQSQSTRFVVSDAFFHSLMQKYASYTKRWFLAYRDVTDSRASVRTVVSTAIPFLPASIKLPVLGVDAESPAHLLLANLNSFALDFVARQKIGGLSLSFFVLKQLPLLAPNRYQKVCEWQSSNSLGQWLSSRVAELVYTNWCHSKFGEDCGWSGPPFRWDEERRFQVRCELDAAFFHLYLPADAAGHWRLARRTDGCPHDETPEELAALKSYFPTPRDAVAYTMDTFPIVRRRDEEKHNGDYRTKRVILEIYDEMQEAVRCAPASRTRRAWIPRRVRRRMPTATSCATRRLRTTRRRTSTCLATLPQ